MTILEEIWTNIAIYYKNLKKKTMKNMNQQIYEEAKSCLRKHITLDPSVPPDVGCAEAVSYVLKLAGVRGFPTTGIAGTSVLYSWLKANATEVKTPVAGNIIISPTGMSSINSPHGHVGIVANFGVLSNDSDSGLFMEKYTLETWAQYFGEVEGFPVIYFEINQ